MPEPIVVRAEWDNEAGVWVATSENLPGLVAEAETVENLLRILPDMISDLLEAEDEGCAGIDVPYEFVASVTRKVRLAGHV